MPLAAIIFRLPLIHAFETQNNIFYWEYNPDIDTSVMYVNIKFFILHNKRRIEIGLWEQLVCENHYWSDSERFKVYLFYFLLGYKQL